MCVQSGRSCLWIIYTYMTIWLYTTRMYIEIIANRLFLQNVLNIALGMQITAKYIPENITLMFVINKILKMKIKILVVIDKSHKIDRIYFVQYAHMHTHSYAQFLCTKTQLSIFLPIILLNYNLPLSWINLFSTRCFSWQTCTIFAIPTKCMKRRSHVFKPLPNLPFLHFECMHIGQMSIFNATSWQLGE